VDLPVQQVHAAVVVFHWDLGSGLVVVESVDLEDRGSLVNPWHFTVNFRIPVFESVISIVGIPTSLEKCPDVFRIG
jgi:hypothetical protein